MVQDSKETLKFNAPSSIIVNNEEGPETFPLHWHNAAEFTVALKDGCKYKVADTVYEINRGDILLVWPGQIHATIKIPKKSVSFIQFQSMIIECNLDLVSVSRFMYRLHKISAKETPELAEYLHERLDRIREIHNSGVRFAETQCKLLISEMLLKLGQYVMAENDELLEAESGSDAGWSYIHAACNYIVENVTNEITQTEVAEYVGLSPYYFSKLFKQYMHMSFPVFISGIRIRKAKSLLLDTSLSITDCAFASGFQSTTAFNRVFRNSTGYSPREYRKLCIVV